jgi:hypothetical protein
MIVLSLHLPLSVDVTLYSAGAPLNWTMMPVTGRTGEGMSDVYDWILERGFSAFWLPQFALGGYMEIDDGPVDEFLAIFQGYCSPHWLLSVAFVLLCFLLLLF